MQCCVPVNVYGSVCVCMAKTCRVPAGLCAEGEADMGI